MGILAAYMVPHPPLIIPDVGRGRERAIQNTIDAYREVGRRIGALRPETLIVISPHQTMYSDYFHVSPGNHAEGDLRQFQAGQTAFSVSYDTGFVEELCRRTDACGLRAGMLGERDRRLDHGTMVPLYFVDQYYAGYKLVRIGLSGLPFAAHYELGQCIKETADGLGRRAVVIASGDLSHRLKEDAPYGYRKEGPEYDRRVMEVMEKGDFSELLDFSEEFCDKAGECGHRSFVMLAGALDKTRITARRLSYEGPFGVGYGICEYTVQGADPGRGCLEQYRERQKERLRRQREQEDAYVRFARMVIEAYVCTGKKPRLPEGLPEEMYSQRAGAFVSIKEDGRLRGCIGTIRAVHGSLAEEIMDNAVNACSRDPRFEPVKPEELDRLTVSVDVLGDMERIDSPDQLDVKRYGVVVTDGHRRGLLLPDLEGVDTVEEQIAIAKQKAGIGADTEATLERFEVVRHSGLF